ncbi:MAG TPA: hypothetical protein VKS82_21785 [Streptosporangiaceae bacterium]|nr:hypothetical protein [Streptosporangiaceae bacterium]
MRGRFSRSLLVMTSAVLALALAPAAAAGAKSLQDPVPIGPNEYFTGLVNNHPPGQAVIYVVCPGPLQPGQTGHPTASQPVEVEPASPTSTGDLGYTGSAGDEITAALGTTSTSIVLASFTSYFVQQYIPTGIEVPCSGTGTVAFIPSPGSSTAKTAILDVTFENIAV